MVNSLLTWVQCLFWTCGVPVCLSQVSQVDEEELNGEVWKPFEAAWWVAHRCILPTRRDFSGDFISTNDLERGPMAVSKVGCGFADNYSWWCVIVVVFWPYMIILRRFNNHTVDDNWWWCGASFALGYAHVIPTNSIEMILNWSQEYHLDDSDTFMTLRQKKVILSFDVWDEDEGHEDDQP